MLGELGIQWASGRLTIAEEHVASESLLRALARVGDALPTRLDGPGALLAIAPNDEHTLGLAMAELCLRELGWTPIWLGRFTPISETVRLVADGKLSLVVLTASAGCRDARALRAVADKVSASCRTLRVDLVLGGAGAWPSTPKHGSRHRHLSDERTEQPKHGR